MEWVRRDEHADLSLMQNENIWRSEASRHKLSRLLWDISRERNDDLFQVGQFKKLEDKYARERPEWFSHNEKMYDPIESSSDQHEVTQSLLAKISSQSISLQRIEKHTNRTWTLIIVTALVLAIAGLF